MKTLDTIAAIIIATALVCYDIYTKLRRRKGKSMSHDHGKELRINESITRPISEAARTVVGQAFNTLKQAIHADPEYAWSWHCNIAMASVDQGMHPHAANRAAAHFMLVCFDVDTTATEQWKSLDIPPTVTVDVTDQRVEARDPNDRTPDVHRSSLPPAEKEMTLYADDSPARPDNTPQIGDQDWTMKIPLHDGTRLNLHMGRDSHRNFAAMLAAEATDDAEDQL